MLNRITLMLTIVGTTLFSCTKENIKTPVAESLTAEGNVSNITSDDLPGKYYDAAKETYKLVLQPGDDGQDALIQWKQDDDANANSNAGQLNELDGFAWTVNDVPVSGRSLIKFTGLSAIPANAKVLGARLFLYGAGSSVTITQGNSGDNVLSVKRVTSAWDESTVTWNTRPYASQNDEAFTEASTSVWYFNTTAEVSDLVKPMIKAPEANNGFLLKLATERFYRSIIFASSESTDAKARPKLVVVYQLP